jgi:hypothetical protein
MTTFQKTTFTNTHTSLHQFTKDKARQETKGEPMAGYQRCCKDQQVASVIKGVDLECSVLLPL